MSGFNGDVTTMMTRLVAVVTLAAGIGSTQPTMPLNAQTDLYFPHLADGGPKAGQWQTRFTFMNPNNVAANVAMNLLSDAGAPLTLNLGLGLTSTPTFTIPANGTLTLQSQITSATLVTGWAYALASAPIQGNVAFRLIENGVAVTEITAEPTLPSTQYRSIATPQAGIAVVNIFNVPNAFDVKVFGSAGQVLGSTTLSVPPNGHTSVNLNQAIAGLPPSFTGSLTIQGHSGGDLVAWAVFSDSSGVISSLPDGRASFPAPQPAEIRATFARVVNAYQTYLSDFGAVPSLVISPENDANAINASASNGTTVQINLALGELISDSPSELAFIIAHEIGHIYQQRTGKYPFFTTDREWDADCWGLLMSLIAGYDPYGGAGALGKLGMATGTANLGVQMWEDSIVAIEAHGSFSTRIDNLTQFVEGVCGFSPSLGTICQQYKALVHPNFPAIPSAPLLRPGLLR